MKKVYGQEKIERIMEKIKDLPDVAVFSFFEVLKTKEREIEKFNKDQLYSGKYSGGNDIKPDYTPLTVKIKRSKGQPADRVTLKDTGNFYKGIEATVKQKSLEIESTEGKTKELFQKYGKAGKILGLNEENHNSIVDACTPFASAKIKEKILKKM